MWGEEQGTDSRLGRARFKSRALKSWSVCLTAEGEDRQILSAPNTQEKERPEETYVGRQRRGDTGLQFPDTLGSHLT